MTPHKLMNRQEFDAALAATDQDALLSLALLDIDHFAGINEAYGPKAGDEVLASLERILTGSLPAGTLVARLGGDEYAVALPDMPAESALILLEEIRQHFSSREPAPGVPRKTQLSIGIACRPTHVTTVPELLRAADEALYRAKAEGRGRAAIFVESKMTLKSNYYSKASLERLAKLSAAQHRTEASLLREALDELLTKYREAQ
ncbi:MAG TPA: GGDEF domain-containing protein [Trueperaceae bacterium]